MQRVACLLRQWLCVGVVVCMTVQCCRNVRDLCVWFALSVSVYCGMPKCFLIHNCLHIFVYLKAVFTIHMIHIISFYELFV